MIGRLFKGGFMTAVYAFLYIPIVILIVNSFNVAKYGVLLARVYDSVVRDPA